MISVIDTGNKCLQPLRKKYSDLHHFTIYNSDETFGKFSDTVPYRTVRIIRS